jgi:hypothetical protein
MEWLERIDDKFQSGTGRKRSSAERAISETFKFREGLSLKLREAPAFYGVIALATVIGGTQRHCGTPITLYDYVDQQQPNDHAKQDKWETLRYPGVDRDNCHGSGRHCITDQFRCEQIND